MSIEAVVKEFEEKSVDIKIFALNESGATVEEAAKTIGVDSDAIAKTLALHLDGIIIVVMSGRARLDNKKFRATFQTKATMLSFEEVEPLTGHPVGGLCPFGLKGSPKIFWTNQYADIIMSTLLRATTITRLKSVPPSLKG